jgi:hypothetical protein
VADEPSGTIPRDAGEIPPEQQVAQAVFSTLWYLYADVPLPGDDPEADFRSSLETLASTDQLSGPSKLEVLARVARSGKIALDDDSVRTLALSLVKPDVDDQVKTTDATWLLGKLEASEEAREPLGREEVTDIQSMDPQALDLLPDIQVTAVAMGVTCTAHPIIANGQKALSIYTFGTTQNPLAGYNKLVDPCNWPTCPVQGVVFKEMEPVDPSNGYKPPGDKTPLVDPPDSGYTSTLREVVDLGFGSLPIPRFTTFLDFVYFDNVTGDETDAIGCTYDIHPGAPITGIVADRGYLLVDNYPDDSTLRRIQTLKEVYFASAWMNLFLSPWICTVWSVASAIIGYACLGKSQP